MSARNAIVLLLSVSTLLFLAACGNNGGSAHVVPPPTGGFSSSDLNGTYVFSVSGYDLSYGTPYAIVGTFTANGSGGITGGTIDINDSAFSLDVSTPIAPISNSPITTAGSNYSLTVDGRGQVKLTTSTPFTNIVLDFVLSSNSHGLVTEFDTYATGSGTLDLQSANPTLTGSYAFSLSGADYTTSGTPYATAGDFTLGSGGAIAGLDDVNEGALLTYPAQTLSGTLALGPATAPGTTLNLGPFNALFDVYAIDATHLKFIEMDTTAVLSGDAFSQTSATMPTGTLAFTLQGDVGSSSSSVSPLAAGGFMVTDGAGNITNTSTEDYNEDGNLSNSTPGAFTGVYTAGGTGRYTLGTFTGFYPSNTMYAAYPSSGGVLLLEIDTNGISTGAAYPQTSGATFAATAQGYGLGLSGIYLGSSVVSAAAVNDTAEFATNPTGTTVTGAIDENSTQGDFFDQDLSGTYTSLSTGRYGITADSGTTSVPGTLNGGFALILYAVDGTTFPYIEYDSGQVAAGVIVQQSTSSSSSAAAPHQNMFVVQPLYSQHQARLRKK